MKNKKLANFTEFLKEKKYYIAVALCILTVGTVGFISYQNAQNAWDKTTLPEQNALDAQDAIIPQDDVTEQSESVSKPTKQPETTGNKEYILPVDGTIDVGYSADIPVYSKTLADWRTHNGIDYTVAIGTEVKAINDGVVQSIETDNLLGVTVTIKHTDGNVSSYSNLENSVTLKKDQLISQGDIVGKVGKTAIIEISQEPHLHFEVSQDGKNIDPLKLYDK